MKESNVVLNPDQKTVLLKTLTDLHYANGQLHEWFKNDSLTDEMSKTMLSLIESHFCQAAEILDYESYLLIEKEKRYEEIRKANLKIRELEEKLGLSRPVDGLKEQLKVLSDKVRNWWGREGFNHVSKEQFMPYGGLKLEFHFMLEHSIMFSKTPESDKKSLEDHIQELRDMGFDFADFEKSRSEKLDLIDNPNNRTLLTKLLKNRFPSLKIDSWVNTSSYSNPDIFVFRYVDATIYDLADI